MSHSSFVFITTIAGKETLKACLLARGLACQSLPLPAWLFVCVFVCLSEWPFLFLTFSLHLCLSFCHPPRPKKMSVAPQKRENNQLLWGELRNALTCKRISLFWNKRDSSFLIPAVLWRVFFVVQMTEWLMRNKSCSLFHSLCASLCPSSLWLTLSVSLHLPCPLFTFSVSVSLFFFSLLLPSFFLAFFNNPFPNGISDCLPFAGCYFYSCAIEVVLTFRCFFFIATSVDTVTEGVSQKHKFLQS